MPVHSDYQAFLDQLAAIGGPALTEMSPAAAREMFRAGYPARPDVVVGNVEDRTLSVIEREIPVRIYTPKGEGPFPVTMMFHGGGWVIGDLDTADGQSRYVCRDTPCVVVSVDYRLAPDHRFPAAAEDCYDATKWVYDHADELNVDPTRLAVSGDSAGGNLAAVVALMARDRMGPPLIFQLLVYPVTNGNEFSTQSYMENAEGYLLTAESMHWFWDHYAEPADRINPYASPLLASNLGDLPRAHVQVAEYDPLRDEGIRYSEALRAAGNDSTVISFDGFIHGFIGHTDTVPVTRRAMQDACESLRNAFYSEAEQST